MKFETEPGFFLSADAWGNPDNQPVILLHGGGQTRHSWGDTAQRLADAGWYAIALDARGHGDSDWSAEGHYSIDYLASDLRSVCAQLSEKPALVGASMGGMTALIAEGERPAGAASICSAIVLVDIAPRSEQKGIERIFAFMSGNQDGFASLDEAAEAVAAYLPNRPRPSDNSRLEKNLRLRTSKTGEAVTIGTGTRRCWPSGGSTPVLISKPAMKNGCIGLPRRSPYPRSLCAGALVMS